MRAKGVPFRNRPSVRPVLPSDSAASTATSAAVTAENAYRAANGRESRWAAHASSCPTQARTRGRAAPSDASPASYACTRRPAAEVPCPRAWLSLTPDNALRGQSCPRSAQEARTAAASRPSFPIRLSVRRFPARVAIRCSARASPPVSAAAAPRSASASTAPIFAAPISRPDINAQVCSGSTHSSRSAAPDCLFRAPRSCAIAPGSIRKVLAPRPA